MATLKKQIWTDQLMKNFYPDASFLAFSKNFTALVEYDKLHMAEVGVDPLVLINNTTYPINTTNRVDTPIEIELDLFETENTLVRSPDLVELSYDKLDSVVYGHKQALRTSTAMKAAHAYAPNSNTPFTPVIETSGEDNGEGFRRLTIKDILLLKRRFDDCDIPSDDRFIVLNPRHTEDLLLQDSNIFKDIFEMKEGKPRKFAGFNFLEFSKTPKYNAVTKEKIVFGALGENQTYCSFAFHKDEVMRADGTVKMYANKDDAEKRATIIGFDKRFIALPIRNKGIGSIIAKKV